MQGGPGDDFIMGGYGDDDIYGGEGDDIIYGTQLNAATYGNDYIEGGPGDDFIAGVDAAPGTDQVIRGGTGNDKIGAGTPIPLIAVEQYGVPFPFTSSILSDGESITT